MRQALNKPQIGGIRTRIAIILVSAVLGLVIAWLAPGLDRYTRDWLMRARGVLPPPDDIAIVPLTNRASAGMAGFRGRDP